MTKRSIIAAIMLLAASCSSLAPKTDEEGSFKFRPDGTFRIVQVTDTHLSIGNSEEETAWVCKQVSDVLESEKPDLLVFTGDIVTSCSTDILWQKMLEGVEASGVPYVVAYGNHDREEQLSDADLPKCYAGQPHNINSLSPEGYLEDMAIEIKSASSDKTSAVLYVMDSGDYSPVETYWDYGWITHDQVHWYVEKSRSFAKANGNVPVPSYAFFHIPLTEFFEAYCENPISGHRGEPECPGELNSGLLSAFEENGDVHGVFVGHDHDNDYIAQEGGVALVYGRCCFFKREGRIPGNGIRVIELTEGDYGFHTWVHEPEGITGDVTYDVPIDFNMRKASPASGKEHGLTRTLYTGVEDVYRIEETAVKGITETVPTPRMIGVMGEKDYGAVLKGYLYVPYTGAWSLHVSANDEGIVTIDDITFRDTDYSRGQKKMHLEQGYHPIKIQTRTERGGCWLKLMWRDQMHARYHEIPAEYYYVE